MRRVYSCKVKPVAVCCVKPYAEEFISKSREIATISGLFNEKYLTPEYDDLLNPIKARLFLPFKGPRVNLKVTMTSLLKQWEYSDLRETRHIIYHSKGNVIRAFRKCDFY